MSILASVRAAINGHRLNRLRQTLGLRLGLLFVLTVLPLGIFSIYQSWTLLNEKRSSADMALVGVTLNVLRPDILILLRAEVALSALSTTLSSTGADPEACMATANAAVTRSRGLFRFAAFADPSGRVTCSSDPIAADLSAFMPPPDRAAFSLALTPAGAVSGEPAVLLMQPVRDAAGITRGHAVIGLTQAQFGAMTDRLPVLGPTELSISLVDVTGTLLGGKGILSEQHWVLPGARTLTGFSPKAETTFDATTNLGGTRRFAAIPLAGGQLFALASIPQLSDGGRFDPVASAITIQIMMVLVGFILAHLAAEWLVGRHVRSLHSAINAFTSGGRREVHADHQAPRELRELAEAFAILIDTIQRDEARREDELRQKVVLLRELNHRVKNNLQLITSMIRLQMRQARTPDTIALLQGLQDRIGSLSAIERAIYLTKDVNHIRADELFDGILRRYRKADGPSRMITFETDVQPIRIQPDQATPLALFVTETITEIVKPHRMDEPAIRLQISLGLIGTDEAELMITDRTPVTEDVHDGAPWLDLSRRLLEAYAKQLRGQMLTDETEEGQQVMLRFPMDPLPGTGE